MGAFMLVLAGVTLVCGFTGILLVISVTMLDTRDQLKRIADSVEKKTGSEPMPW